MKTVKIPDLYPGTYTVGKSNRDYILAKGAELHDSVDGGGIFEPEGFSGNAFHINGIVDNNVFPTGIAMVMRGAGSDVNIGKSGDILGFNIGIWMTGADQVLVNNGHVEAQNSGITAVGDNKNITNNGEIVSRIGLDLTGDGRVANNGMIDADRIGINWVDGSGLLTLGKDSEITSDNVEDPWGVAISRVNDAGVKSRTINEGHVDGANYSFQSYDGDETLINRGTMTGKISLGNGADTFDNSKGLFTGTVDGGAGGDTYFVGASPYTIVEADNGTGTDAIKSARTFQLDAAWNIEDLYLIGKKNVNANGDSGENHLFGNKGNNHLAGLGGEDILTGGGGKDVFQSHDGDGGDKITDFRNGIDKIDLSGWTTIDNLAELKANAYLFYTDGNTTIVNGLGDSLELTGFNIDKLDRTDFIF